jgi:F-type H+-transporting ATPase subunit delta
LQTDPEAPLIQGSIARRYARALFQIGVEEERFEQLGEDLLKAAGVLVADPDLVHIVTSPTFGREQRHETIDALAKALRLHTTAKNALHLLVDRNRIEALPDIAREYRALADEKAGRVRCRVETAVPLSKEALAHVEKALHRATGRTVELETAVEPALIGGAVARVASTVYDGSIATALARMREELKTRPL